MLAFLSSLELFQHLLGFDHSILIVLLLLLGTLFCRCGNDNVIHIIIIVIIIIIISSIGHFRVLQKGESVAQLLFVIVTLMDGDSKGSRSRMVLSKFGTDLSFTSGSDPRCCGSSIGGTLRMMFFLLLVFLFIIIGPVALCRNNLFFFLFLLLLLIVLLLILHERIWCNLQVSLAPSFQLYQHFHSSCCGIPVSFVSFCCRSYRNNAGSSSSSSSILLLLKSLFHGNLLCNLDQVYFGIFFILKTVASGNPKGSWYSVILLFNHGSGILNLCFRPGPGCRGSSVFHTVALPPFGGGSLGGLYRRSCWILHDD
mmetsp:Transcript_41760/g.100559  ORF Transcript_41760/g.100559 Transcript_41760/m.100559 type:complete len:312 (-) Transcript_41760:64-999(-)